MTVKEYNHTVENCSDHLYRFVLKNIKNEAKAQDIVQDSFEKLWINRIELNFEKAKSYLFVIANRTMIDNIRKDKPILLTNDHTVYETRHEENYNDLNEVLQKAIEKLSYEQRTVILLRDLEGYSYDEIGEITEMTEAQVKMNIYRARLFLKNYIGKIENVV